MHLPRSVKDRSFGSEDVERKAVQAQTICVRHVATLHVGVSVAQVAAHGHALNGCATVVKQPSCRQVIAALSCRAVKLKEGRFNILP